MPSRTFVAARAALASLGLVAGAGAQQPAPFPSAVYPMSGFAQRLLAADLDLDGRTDYVALDALDRLSVQLGTAAGGIGAPQDTPLVLPSPWDFAIGALEGDAWPDVVVSGWKEFAIYRGTGSGAFLPPQTLASDLDDVRAVALGDVNGDGLADIVSSEIGNTGPSYPARVRLAVGSGFGAPQQTALPFFARRVLLAPMDGDATPDAVFVGFSQVGICRSTGSGALLQPTTLTLPEEVQDAAVADFDGDGDLDLAIAYGNDWSLQGHVGVRIGDGLGGFSPGPDLVLGDRPVAVAAADLEGDGDNDLLAARGLWDSTLSVFVNPGDGAVPVPTSCFIPERVTGLIATDASGDGRLDAVTSSASGPALNVLAGDGAGGFHGLQRLPSWKPSTLHLLDVDGDGTLDMLTAHRTQPGYIGVASGDGSGVFGEEILHAADARAWDVAAGDLDGDGVSDGACAADDGIELFFHLGTGTASAPWLVPVDGQRVYDIALDDLDADGDLDALVDAATVVTPVSTRLVALAGDGAGHLAIANSVSLNVSPQGVLARGDMDDDGLVDTDVLTGSSIRVVRSLGGFAFSAVQSFSLGTTCYDFALGDLDLDGALDVATRAIFKVGVLRGDGGGGLLPPVFVADAGTLGGVAVGDVTGDGWPDVLATHKNFSRFALLANDGTGNLLAPVTFGSSIDSTALAIADVNGDGRPDCASAGAPEGDLLGELTLSLNLSDSFTWTDLGSALPGSKGPPQLAGLGTLLPGSPGELRLLHARPLAPAVLLVSAQSVPTPIKGGVMLASPALVTLFVVTDGAGQLSLDWTAWPSSAPGADWFFQAAVKDPAAVHGLAFSNALRAIEPE